MSAQPPLISSYNLFANCFSPNSNAGESLGTSRSAVNKHMLEYGTWMCYSSPNLNADDVDDDTDERMRAYVSNTFSHKRKTNTIESTIMKRQVTSKKYKW